MKKLFTLLSIMFSILTFSQTKDPDIESKEKGVKIYISNNKMIITSSKSYDDREINIMSNNGEKIFNSKDKCKFTKTIDLSNYTKNGELDINYEIATYLDGGINATRGRIIKLFIK